jgi:predicted flap endonuclease-1-like 5' DNA nuclease
VFPSERTSKCSLQDRDGSSQDLNQERAIAMSSVIEIEGIGEVYAQKLQEAGVNTTESLLEQGATPRGRKALADSTGISERLILKWVNRADLFRISGIGEQYSDLLAAAGVETVLELAQRRPDHLHEKLVETNEAKKLVRVVPGLEHVTDWVSQAHQLSRVVSY